MLIMTAGLMVLGTYPGLLLDHIDAAGKVLGVTFSKEWWEMSALYNGWGDNVNLQNVSISIGGVFMMALVFLTWKNYKSTRYVSTKDISTSGEVPKEHENLTYQLDFYKPFERAIAPVMKYSMDKIYTAIGKGLEGLFQGLRYIYNGNGQTYAFYVVIFLVILLIFGKNFLV